ncbi:hypothetical protein JM951_01735 [Xanthomonas fragariae]|nr:hypothetical protein [Xanthomonas fragariae]MBL9220173.1 hypothetical protein [Xanthomonas fragariae]
MRIACADGKRGVHAAVVAKRDGRCGFIKAQHRHHRADVMHAAIRCFALPGRGLAGTRAGVVDQIENDLAFDAFDASC